MAIVSFRLRCEECANEEVVRDDQLDDSGWMVLAKYQHSGKCPSCNPTFDADEDERYSDADRDVPFEELDDIGAQGAENLREGGFVTYSDIRLASDDEILEIAWIGEGGLESIRREVS